MPSPSNSPQKVPLAPLLTEKAPSVSDFLDIDFRGQDVLLVGLKPGQPPSHTLAGAMSDLSTVSGPKRIFVDLGNRESSDEMASSIVAFVRSALAGVTVAMTGISNDLQKKVRGLGVLEHFKVYKSRAEALDKLQAADLPSNRLRAGEIISAADQKFSTRFSRETVDYYSLLEKQRRVLLDPAIVVKVNPSGRASVVSLSGKGNGDTRVAQTISEKLGPVVKSEQVERVIVNLGELSELREESLGALLHMQRVCARLGKSFEVCGVVPSSSVDGRLRMAGLHRFEGFQKLNDPVENFLSDVA